LSLITQKPFRIANIRANRAKPGLRRQHLTAVRAAARIGGAEVDGASLNSTELTFRPGRTRAGEYTFDVGSAGSTTLVFQTVLPALLLADGPSVLRFVGGTHNHGGPPWDFLNQVFLPAIRRMGAKVTATLERHGFAPGGGGEWTARIQPSRLHGIELHERGPLRRRSVRALVSNLPISIAEREINTIAETLPWPASAEVVDALGPGNIVMISAEYANVAELATGFGQRGVPAEIVAKTAVDCWQSYERTEAPVGEHLADQLLLPMAIAGSGSFSTIDPTLHTITNAEVIAKFLACKFRIEPVSGGVWTISL
jgi:RNA 3'-terminal phosphate cyclase (ATP)